MKEKNDQSGAVVESSAGLPYTVGVMITYANVER